MAVVMTTKFYEEDTPAWHDLSKVVFTSPNMDSPNSAGTRSHILPGQLDLGMWYEDTSNMYIVEVKQETDASTYFGYSARLYESFDMSSPPLYITIDQTNQSDWIEYVRERVDVLEGSWPMQYQTIIGGYSEISFVEATYSGSITVHATTEDGVGGEIPLVGAVFFSSSFYPMEVEFGCKDNMSAKNFYIKNNGTTLLAGVHTDSTSVETFSFDQQTTHFSDYYITLDTNYGLPDDYVSITHLKFFGYYASSEYTVASVTCSSGTDPINIFNSVGWYADETGADPHWVIVGFSSPKRVTKIKFNNYAGYEIKDYKIQACTTYSGTYTDLYSGRATFGSSQAQRITFDNYIGYSYYKFYFYSRYASSAGYGISRCDIYEYAEDEGITTPITLYIDNENTIKVSHANNAESTDYLFKLGIDSVNGTGTVVSGTTIYGWGQTGTSEDQVKNTNSILFELTVGECYDCRLTAWDDVTHSTTINELIASDRCRVSCLTYNATGTSISPTENEGVSFIHPPALNKIFKGDVVYEGEQLYYGDFDMKYRTGEVLGDYLIFKPMLYNINDTVSYGIHDHVITLHYSYT